MLVLKVAEVMFFVSYVGIAYYLLKIARARWAGRTLQYAFTEGQEVAVVATFGAFIFACALSHAFDLSLFWIGWQHLVALVKLIGGTISVFAWWLVWGVSRAIE